MWPFECELNQIDEALLRDVVQKGVRECQGLDYKQCLQDGEKWKLPLLKDVAAMANAGGGHIVIGVAEDRTADEGTPGNVLGIADWSAQATKIKQLALDCISPRIIGFDIAEVSLKDSGGCLVIRVPTSGNRPHMITFDKKQLFMRRHARINQVMTLDEIRQLVLATHDLRERINAFIDRRRIELELYPENVGNPTLWMYAFPATLGDERIDALSRDVREFMNRATNAGRSLCSLVNVSHAWPTLHGIEQVDHTTLFSVHRTGFVDFAGWSAGNSREAEGAGVIFDYQIFPAIYWWTSVCWEFVNHFLSGETLLIGAEILNAQDTALHREVRDVGRMWKRSSILLPTVQCDLNASFRVATKVLCDRLAHAFKLEGCYALDASGTLGQPDGFGGFHLQKSIPWPVPMR